MLSDLADGLGLTDALSVAMAPTKQRRRGHDRGRVLVDVATMIADGGEAISDGRMFLLWKSNDNSEGFGPTIWSQALTPDGTGLVGSPVRLVSDTAAWQFPVIERPAMTAFLWEFFVFGVKQARACIFAGTFLAVLLASKHLPLFGLARYDFLCLAAILIQLVLVKIWRAVHKHR